MAKKKRRGNNEPEETYEFVPPEFDEREFLLKDIYGTKILIVVSLLAVAIGFIASCLHKYTGYWELGLLLIILTVVALKQLLVLMRFRADLLDVKTLVGNYILFFFLALGIYIILLNPPFT